MMNGGENGPGENFFKVRCWKECVGCCKKCVRIDDMYDSCYFDCVDVQYRNLKDNGEVFFLEIKGDYEGVKD